MLHCLDSLHLFAQGRAVTDTILAGNADLCLTVSRRILLLLAQESRVYILSVLLDIAVVVVGSANER